MSRDYQLQPFRAPVELQIDYAHELNPQQHAAVTAVPGPSLVIAGAGSGKTRTLTYRVAYLIEQGIPADRILLLTFTNKAAKEMMRRVGDLLGGDPGVGGLWGGTFHSVGNRVLRRHAELIGYKADFTILDREDAKDLINACIDEAKIDTKATRFPKADVIGNIFSLAINRQESIGETLLRDHGEYAELTDQIVDLQTRYAARKLASGAMDFDDLMVLWLKLMRDHQDVREHYQRRFQFILVDEYQDTNRLQSDLIDLLGERHKNVMVVGDDSQSIYSWRGANFLNILEFPKRYPGTAIYKIETNYRSTPEILTVANAVIAPNTRQFAKELASSRKSGIRPGIIPCGDSGVQAAFVAQRALELREEGITLDEMAVLYRSHFHALELQLELTKRNIPFSITSGIRFFEQAHVKDVAAYLKLVCNPRDELAFKRLVKMLPGIGGKGADKLWSAFLANYLPDTAPGAVPLATAMQKSASSVPKKAVTSWAQMCATLSQLEVPELRGKPDKMIALVIEADYEDYAHATFTNAESRLEDLEQLGIFARQFETMEDFLTQVALMTSIEAEDQSASSSDDERLRLSSIHQAKGLEFKIVFIIMLCEGMFPSTRSLDFEDSLEEERRLFYVAVTRAKDELYLSYPLVRASASGGDWMQHPSRFLSEIPKALCEEWNLRSFSPYG